MITTRVKLKISLIDLDQIPGVNKRLLYLGGLDRIEHDNEKRKRRYNNNLRIAGASIPDRRVITVRGHMVEDLVYHVKDKALSTKGRIVHLGHQSYRHNEIPVD